MRHFHFALFLLVLLLPAKPLVAATYYVGGCKSGAFTSINAAVTTVPAGSIIDVCPGVYPEQVIISKALTLRGIVGSDELAQTVITVPSGSMATASSIDFGTVTMQVEVTAGPVDISDIIVDGAQAGTNCPNVGIFYNGGSSGTVSGVEARNLCGGPGSEILAENGAGPSESVTIEDSYIHAINFAGIVTCSNQTPSTLTATIRRNYVVNFKTGIAPDCNTAGSVDNNLVGSNTFGIQAFSAFTDVLHNTFSNSSILVWAPIRVSHNTFNGGSIAVNSAGATVESNEIVNTTNSAIALTASDVILKDNIIIQANIGIEFGCNTGTVSGNTINGASTGIDMVPSIFTGVNRFNDVTTVRTGGC